MEFLATTLQGLENLLADELRAIGANRIKLEKRAVKFEGDKKLMYRANLELRTAIRILKPINQFRVRHESALYSKIKQIDWSEYMGLKNTFAITGTTFSNYFNHSKYVALKSKDAIADQFREHTGERPNVEVRYPDLRINVHINDDLCTVSLDSSAESLHLRGYRRETGEAPINEVLAAGMVMLSGWDKKQALIDPMCGSGTILIEAAMIAGNIPPQLNRYRFGFFKWKDFDKDMWAEVLEEAKSRIVEIKAPILGYDKDFQIVRMAERNIDNAGLSDAIKIQRKRLEKLEPEFEKGMMITNPPYDVRLEDEDINALYKMMGDRFKQQFAGYQVWLISSNMDAFKHVGLRTSKRIALFNGALQCRFARYDMF